MAQEVRYMTLDFGSGHDLTVCEFKLLSGFGLSAQSLLGILSLPLFLPLPASHSVSLSKKKKYIVTNIIISDMHLFISDLVQRVVLGMERRYKIGALLASSCNEIGVGLACKKGTMQVPPEWSGQVCCKGEPGLSFNKRAVINK